MVDRSTQIVGRSLLRQHRLLSLGQGRLHTHRSGPHPGEEADWELPGGGSLLNSGSWIHEPAFLGQEPKRSPYWPGTSVWVEDGGPPELRRLID